jgi:hypothetical protein
VLYCSALRGRTLTGGGLSFESSVAGERHTRSIFENCIEKNFHVSNMKRGPHRDFRPRADAISRSTKKVRAHRWIPWHHRR